MINPLHLREAVIGPVLELVKEPHRELEQLLIETALWETTLCNLWSNEEMDHPNGIGLWGISPADYAQVVEELAKSRVRTLQASRIVPFPDGRPPSSKHMAWNLAWSCFVAFVLWDMVAPLAGRWPASYEERWRWWSGYWIQEDDFRTLDQYRYRMRLLSWVEHPIAMRRQTRHRAPRVKFIPGRLPPPMPFSLS